MEPSRFVGLGSRSEQHVEIEVLVSLLSGVRTGLVLLTLCVIGCGKGGGSGHDLIPATGVLKMDGKEVEGANITLIPQAGVVGKGGYGVTGTDGSFALQTSPSEPGVVAGKYLVLITKYTMPDGSKIPDGMSAADAGLTNAIPKFYSDPSTSDVYVDFPPADGKPLVIGIQSKRR